MLLDTNPAHLLLRLQSQKVLHLRWAKSGKELLHSPTIPDAVRSLARSCGASAELSFRIALGSRVAASDSSATPVRNASDSYAGQADVDLAIGRPGLSAHASEEYAEHSSAVAAYRAKVVSMFSRLHSVGCPLRYLDEHEITPDEVCRSGVVKGDVEPLRYAISIHHVLESIPTGLRDQTEALRSMKLPGHNLSVLRDAGGKGLGEAFPQLVELDLHNNALDVPVR